MKCTICNCEVVKCTVTNETRYYDLIDDDGILEYKCTKCGSSWKTTSNYRKEGFNKNNKFMAML